MIPLSMQQSFWSVFRKLRITIAVRIYVIKVPVQPRPLPKTFYILTTCILDNLTTARSKVMVCLPGYLCLTDSQNLCKLHSWMIVLFARPVQHQLHCQEQFKSLQNSNRANFPQTHSRWNIWSHCHQVNMWNAWLEYCCRLSNLPPLSFSSHPRGVIDKI